MRTQLKLQFGCSGTERSRLAEIIRTSSVDPRGLVCGGQTDVMTDITVTSPSRPGGSSDTLAAAGRRSMARASGGRQFDRERAGRRASVDGARARSVARRGTTSRRLGRDGGLAHSDVRR